MSGTNFAIGDYVVANNTNRPARLTTEGPTGVFRLEYTDGKKPDHSYGTSETMRLTSNVAKELNEKLAAISAVPEIAAVSVPSSVGDVPKHLEAMSNSVSNSGGDWSDAVLDGRLGEICSRRMVKGGQFPISYAWPSIVTAAGTMVPSSGSPSAGLIVADDQMTNFFTGLVGPVHSGKSQAIAWANRTIGVPRSIYSEVRAASSESLLKKLNGMQKKGELGRSLFVDLDEWKHLFDKASIEHASFASFLHTSFYKRKQNVVLAGGFEVEVDCALTFIGGIVQDEFDECFGARSMGGLHDRFMFGLSPEGYNFFYRPFEGLPETTNPVAVTIDRDVWEMVDALRRANPKIGREAEIATRVAHVCASFDGRSVLHAKDCEIQVKAFIAEQLHIRDILKPNEGQTSDAVCANALLQWLQRNGPDGGYVSERKVQHGLRRTLSRLGPGALKYAIQNLSQQGLIRYGDIPGAKKYGGRVPKAYELVIPEKEEQA